MEAERLYTASQSFSGSNDYQDDGASERAREAGDALMDAADRALSALRQVDAENYMRMARQDGGQ